MRLELIKTCTGELLLEASEEGQELEFYDVDGEGGKATKIGFAPWNQEYFAVPGVTTEEFDTEDLDSFWSALEKVLTSAREIGIELPEYAAY